MNTKQKKLVLILVALFAAIGCFVTFKYLTNKETEGHMGNFLKAHPDSETIIFLGNSITNGFDLTRFGRTNMINMGVKGDFTIDILARLDKVTKANPVKVFLMIGINDILLRVPMKTIKRNYSKIIRVLRRDCPQMKLYIQSTLPVCVRPESGFNNDSAMKDIIELNTFLKSTCREQKIAFIELFPDFVNDSMVLDSSLTSDGIHLTGLGYALWAEKIAKYVNEK